MKPTETPTAYDLYIHSDASPLEDMIEFAKLHVQAALEAAAENAEAIEGYNTGISGSAASVDKQSILNAYPLDNIK